MYDIVQTFVLANVLIVVAAFRSDRNWIGGFKNNSGDRGFDCPTGLRSIHPHWGSKKPLFCRGVPSERCFHFSNFPKLLPNLELAGFDNCEKRI